MSKHGMVKAVDTHFEYEDGAYFFPFGTTIYAFAHQSRELIEETFASLENSPFNKVRMCVFPKHYAYNNNEPLYYPFEKRDDGSWDPSSPVEDFWNNLETIIKRLDDLDIQCDLILFHSYDNWGFARMSQEDNLKYLDYCLKRLGNLDNIWWSLANEYDLLYSEISLEQWYEIEEFVATHNPKGHLISNHNCFKTWDVSRKNITHGSYQIKNLCFVSDRINEYKKPICVDECCYEGNLPDAWGNLNGQEMTARFWMAITSGAYCTHGETFLDENDVIWWAKGGKLKGSSPERIAFLRNIIEEINKPLIGYKENIFASDSLPTEVREVFETSPAGKSIGQAMSMIDPVELAIMDTYEHEYKAKAEDDSVILNYLYLRSPGLAWLNLPKTQKYKVEIIDTWNMIREAALENVSGFLKVKLPSKPYMAILATEI